PSSVAPVAPSESTAESTTFAAPVQPSIPITDAPTSTQFVATSAVVPTTTPASVTATVATVPSSVAALASGTPSAQPPAITDNNTATVFTELLKLASSSASSDIKQSIVQIPTKAIVPNAEPVTFAGAKLSNATDGLINQAILQLGSSAFNFANIASNFVVYDSVSIKKDSVKYVPTKNGFVISYLLGSNVTDVWYALKLTTVSVKTVHVDILSGHIAIGSFDVVVTDNISAGKKRRSGDPVFVITSGTGRVSPPTDGIFTTASTLLSATGTAQGGVQYTSTTVGQATTATRVATQGASQATTQGATQRTTQGATQGATNGGLQTTTCTGVVPTTTCTGAIPTTTCTAGVVVAPTGYVAPPIPSVSIPPAGSLPGQPASGAPSIPGSYVPPSPGSQAGGNSGSGSGYVPPVGNAPGSQNAYVVPVPSKTGVPPAGNVPVNDSKPNVAGPGSNILNSAGQQVRFTAFVGALFFTFV
ncbi:hypothetical protein HDU99_006654, partial [Rhizoclosmatium hyalinum]